MDMETNEPMMDGEIINQEYITSINQLIAEPGQPSKTQYFLATLYQLSQYLFQKKVQNQQTQQEEQSFDDYLNSVAQEFTVYDTLNKKSKESKMMIQLDAAKQESTLIECYQKVPYLFFEHNFVLNFGELSRNHERISDRQEDLNQQLDLVQINLFSQIHNKFHDYFKVVANFDYLSQSLVINICKVKQSRRRIQKVKKDFVNKSDQLRKLITHRQNLEKALKMAKIIKSLKKLPVIINEILNSSLPYECLSLLKSTKESLNQVEGLNALTKTSQMIKESEALVQMGLNKRYTDQLYLYIEECQAVDLKQNWDRINTHNCMDVSALNNSYLGTSGILDESILDMQPSAKDQRSQGKQYEITMILLQSYRYVEFPAELTRIKICNSLRVFAKKFQRELALWLKGVFSQKAEKAENYINKQEENEENGIKPLHEQKQQNEQILLTENIVEKVTATFYVKHLYIFNQILKETIDRYLGYLHTLLSQFGQLNTKDQAKFIVLFKEELNILPSVFKIIIQKIKFLMTLKNISNVGLQQFLQWIGVLEYWQKYIDHLIEEHPLINYEGPLEQITSAIEDNLKKVVSIMSIKNTINEISLSFVTSFHSNVISVELNPALEDESWQSVQVPGEFIGVLNSITKGVDGNMSQNISITILNDSAEIKGLNKSLNKSLNSSTDKIEKPIIKFKLLKNTILVDGNRYKVSLSFLLLCEFIEEYIKMAKVLNCQKYICERMFDLIDSYNNRTRELILEAQARKFQKIKSKNISARHLCLLHNCLSLLIKLVHQISFTDSKELKIVSINSIESHKKRLIEKLSDLLKGRVQNILKTYFTTKDSKPANTNLTLLNVLVQMMEIVDEYLEFEHRKLVFQESINLFISKYFKDLIMKGNQYKSENKVLLQKMKFLRQYFPQELQLMERQIEEME